MVKNMKKPICRNRKCGKVTKSFINGESRLYCNAKCRKQDYNNDSYPPKVKKGRALFKKSSII